MDTVILAAGRGERLKGIVAEFHKPLMVVNGRAMITQVVDAVRDNIKLGQIIIVAAPDNVSPMINILGDKIDEKMRFVIQPRPTGPGDGLGLGLELVTPTSISTHTLVLCADNIMDSEDIAAILSTNPVGQEIIVGTRTTRNEAVAARMTRVDMHEQSFIESPTLEAPDGNGEYHCWLGPLALPTFETKQTVTIARTRDEEMKISPILNALVKHHGASVYTEPVNCYDVGIPEML